MEFKTKGWLFWFHCTSIDPKSFNGYRFSIPLERQTKKGKPNRNTCLPRRYKSRIVLTFPSSMLILGCFSHMGSVFINGHVVESLKVFVFKVPVRNIWIRIATEHGMQKSEDYSFKTFDDLVFFTKHIVPHQYFSFDHVEASHFELKDTRCPAELQCHDTIKNENKIMLTTCRLTFDCRSNNIYVATLNLFSRHKYWMRIAAAIHSVKN